MEGDPYCFRFGRVVLNELSVGARVLAKLYLVLSIYM